MIYPPACRRVLWILLVCSCAVCLSLSLARFSPSLIFASSNLNPPSHASLNTGLVLHTLLSFRWLFLFFCCVCHRFAPSLLTSNTWSAGFCAEHLYTHYNNLSLNPKLFSIWPFPKPWLTHMLWFKLKPWFERNQCFCVQTLFYTKSCFTQKLCYPQTQCFTQKPCSCWACARAVCSLQDSSCPGGRRNTPKAVKYMGVIP